MTEGVFGAAADDGSDPLSPEHVAPLVAFLASPAAETVSGQVFVAHGGFVGLMAAPAYEARFTATGDHFTVEDLAVQLGAHFEQRDPRQTFAALSVLQTEAAAL